MAQAACFHKIHVMLSLGSSDALDAIQVAQSVPALRSLHTGRHTGKSRHTEDLEEVVA